MKLPAAIKAALIGTAALSFQMHAAEPSNIPAWQQKAVEDLFTRVRANDAAGLAKSYPKVREQMYPLLGFALNDRNCRLLPFERAYEHDVRLLWNCGGKIERLWGVRFDGREIVAVESWEYALMPVAIPKAPPQDNR